MNPKQYLKRSGRRKVTFYGVQIAFATDKGKVDDPDEWVNVIIYSNDNGGYVVGIGFITTIDGKWDKLIAEKVRTVKDAVQVVRDHVPDLADSISEQLNRKQVQVNKKPVFVSSDSEMAKVYPNKRQPWTSGAPIKMKS